MTALSLLQGLDGPISIFGSKERYANDLQRTREFVDSLLALVARNPSQLQRRALTKKALWHILLFNLPRVAAYLDKLIECLGECVTDCKRRDLSCSCEEPLRLPTR